MFVGNSENMFNFFEKKVFRERKLKIIAKYVKLGENYC